MEINIEDLQKERDQLDEEFSELSQKDVEDREELSGMYMWSNQRANSFIHIQYASNYGTDIQKSRCRHFRY